MSDKEETLALIEQGHTEYAVRRAAPEVRADREVLLVAVKKSGNALNYASADLQSDTELVHIAKGFDNTDREAVLKVVRRDGGNLRFASKGLQSDKEFVLAAVARNGTALQHASKALQNDKELVLAAVAQDWTARQHASAELQEDAEIAAAVHKSSKEETLARIQGGVWRRTLLRDAPARGWRRIAEGIPHSHSKTGGPGGKKNARGGPGNS
jgi:hypothetical protein